jgi:hypothetical protein
MADLTRRALIARSARGSAVSMQAICQINDSRTRARFHYLRCHLMHYGLAQLIIGAAAKAFARSMFTLGLPSSGRGSRKLKSGEGHVGVTRAKRRTVGRQGLGTLTKQPSQATSVAVSHQSNSLYWACRNGRLSFASPRGGSARAAHIPDERTHQRVSLARLLTRLRLPRKGLAPSRWCPPRRHILQRARGLSPHGRDGRR